MTKLLMAALLALAALPAAASCTWTYSGHTAVGTCTTGTESTLAASDGLPLVDWRAFSGVSVYAETAGTMTASVLQAWAQNPVTGAWMRVPDLDLTVQALAKQGWFGLSVPSPTGRIAWLPSGTGLATTIYIIGSN